MSVQQAPHTPTPAHRGAPADLNGFSFSHTPPDYKNGGDIPSPRRLKRKAGSANLVMRKHESPTPSRLIRDQSPHDSDALEVLAHTQRKQFTSHPHLPKQTRINDTVLDLLPYYSTVDTEPPAPSAVSKRTFHASADVPPRLKGAPALKSLLALIDDEDCARQATPNLDDFLSASPITLQHPFSTLSSDLSTPSFSRFPLPPRKAARVADATPEPVTPIYHFRGASFEFVNPRNSLFFQSIETPGEPEDDQEPRGYFTFQPKSDMAPPDTAFAPTPRKLQDVDQSTARSTPPRSLFDDLPSAYNSITSRSGHKHLNHSPPVDMPLPTTPLPTSSRNGKMYSAYQQYHLDNSDNQAHGYEGMKRKDAPASFRKRLSALLRASKTDTSDKKPQPSHEPQTPALSLHSPSSCSSGTPWTARHLLPESPSAAKDHHDADGALDDGSSYHYYDNPSIFGFGSEHSASHSQFPDVSATERQLSTRTTDGSISRDNSTGDIIASYAEDRRSAPLPVTPPQLRRRSMPLLSGQGSREGRTATDTTIGLLLNQYGQGFATTTDVDMDNLRSRFASTHAAPHQTFPDLRHLPSSHARAKSLGHAGLDIRSATARALEAPSAPPTSGLPSTPDGSDLQHAQGTNGQGINRESFTQSDAYGNTRQLLLLSEPTAEAEPGMQPIHHGGENEAEQVPSVRLRRSCSLRDERHLSIPNVSRRASSRSVDGVISRDLHYLSGISGLSGDSDYAGSVFFYQDPNVPSHAEQDDQRQSVQYVFGQESKRAHVLRPINADAANNFARRGSIIPIAAFSRSIVEPGTSRVLGGDQATFDRSRRDFTQSDSHTSSASDSEGSVLESNDDLRSDWETVADSRPTFIPRANPSGSTEESSSVSFNTLNRVGLLPRGMNYPNNYDLRADAPVMEPSYSYHPDFVHPGASSSTTWPTLYTSYSHPTPISPYSENPFTSSPPQITDPTTERPRSHPRNSLETAESLGSNHQAYQNQFFRVPNLSIIQEQTEHGLTSDLMLSRISEHPGINSSTSSVVLSIDSSYQVGSEPGPAVSLEGNDWSPQEWKTQKPRSSILSSGANASLLNKLRVDDPRMGSSPLSGTNSFNKFSHLGPKGNVTGSPFGTGMQEAGSSVIGSSPAYGSSPPEPEQSSPITPESVLRWNTEGSRLISDPNSPLARFDQQRYFSALATSQINPSTSPKDEAENHLKPPKVSNKRSKRSVSGQRNLLEMTLVDHQGLARGRDGTNTRTHRPLIPNITSPAAIPRLRHRYRSPSSSASALCNRKRRISWVCFAVCAIFPYLLILYGHNALDPVMVFLTKGEIQHFGRRQKQYAKIVGWSVAGATILTVIVAFVVIRTLPNTYPRLMS